MITLTNRAAAPAPRPAAARTWRTTTGLTALAGGGVVVTGAFLPWVETFAGLIGIPGVHGSHGRILAAAGALVALAGLWHAIRGGVWSRWLAGLGGFAALGFSGYLLIRLAVTLRTLGGDSMVLASAGPGLWVTAGGALLAFTTLFLPAPSSDSPGAANSPGAPYDSSKLPFPSLQPPSLLGRTGAAGAWAGRVTGRVLSRTADLDSAGIRRGLQIALGLLWLLDAALQLQPYMFGPAFVRNVIMPASVGNPAVIASPAIWAGHLIGHEVAAWNTVFALVQLAIAVGLLWRQTVRAALIGSVAWSLAVWWLGEGFGGLLTGTANPVTGAPGAVILYALIAVLIWPGNSVYPGGATHPGRVGTVNSGRAGALLTKLTWLVLWTGSGYLILQPAVRAPHALASTVADGAAGEPGWLTAVDHGTAGLIGSHGAIVCAVVAVLFVLIAAGILRPVTTRPALVLAAMTGVALWVVGENFGQLFTGMATDPNTGPLLVLLAVAYWPPRRPAEGNLNAVA